MAAPPQSDDPRRAVPGVDRVLARPWCDALIAQHGRPWITARVRAVLARLRAGAHPTPTTDQALADLIRAEVAQANAPSLRPVVNATGVVLHTNLGRAPLAAEAREAMAAASGYASVEFDLTAGERGSRSAHCARLLAELTGADDAVVVNNGAGALALALASLAGGKGVVVSHGELVEIGGGFRIPEVVEAAGAKLVAVGTTNRTRQSDYVRAVEDGGVGAILKVHRSNFRMTGFTGEAGLPELAQLAAARGLPLVHDLGSGLLTDPGELGLPSEPTPAQSVAAGADVVVFSGDKLMGGPQSGVVAGSREHVALAKAHPLCRALRCGKTTLAGVEATLSLYRDPERARERVPALRMIAAPALELEQRARAVLASVPGLEAEVGAGESLVGGGTFPGAGIPTAVLRIPAAGADADAWLAALRAHDPPVVARSRAGKVALDFRTVLPEQDAALTSALATALRAAPSRP